MGVFLMSSPPESSASGGAPAENFSTDSHHPGDGDLAKKGNLEPLSWTSSVLFLLWRRCSSGVLSSRFLDAQSHGVGFPGVFCAERDSLLCTQYESLVARLLQLVEDGPVERFEDLVVEIGHISRCPSTIKFFIIDGRIVGGTFLGWVPHLALFSQGRKGYSAVWGLLRRGSPGLPVNLDVAVIKH